MILSVFSYSRAMEIIKQDPLVPCDNICYLSKMPQNVTDRIAHFLGWETRKAFVERTRRYVCGQNGFPYFYNALSPDKKRRAILHVDEREPWYVELNVYNVNKNKKKSAVFNMPFIRGYSFTQLDFNLQATVLLARYFYSPSGKVWFCEKDESLFYKKRIFFKLNSIVHYEKPSGDKKEENVLEEYLKHHLVCKKVT